MTEGIIIELIKGLATVIVALLTTYGAYTGVTKLSGKDKIDNLKLSSHPIFSRAELNKNVILTYFTLENKGKENIFKEILINHMDIYKKHIIALCTKIENKDISNSNDLYAASVDTINHIINDIRVFYKYKSTYSDEDINVLELVMNKYNHWDYDREIEIVTRIQEICGSAFYPDIYTKAVTVFDTFLFAMNDTVADANKTLKNINGDLKGLTFKGVVI